MPSNWHRNPFRLGGHRQPPRSSSDSNLTESALTVQTLDDSQRNYVPRMENRPVPTAPALVPRSSEFPAYKSMLDQDIIFRGGQGESVETHVRRFEYYSELNQLGEREKVRAFLFSLKGAAESWFLCLKDTFIREAELRAREEGRNATGFDAFSYPFLKELLLKRFQTPHRKHLAQNELIRIAQGPKEKVSDYAARLQQLGEVAYGHLTHKDRQENCIQPFIAGLVDPSVKMHVLAAQPETLDTAFEIACSIESSKEVIENAHKPPSKQTHHVLHTNTVAHSNWPQNNQGQGYGRNRNGMHRAHQRTPFCGYCRIDGHAEIDCRTKVRDLQRGQSDRYTPQGRNTGFPQREQRNGYHGRNQGNPPLNAGHRFSGQRQRGDYGGPSRSRDFPSSTNGRGQNRDGNRFSSEGHQQNVRQSNSITVEEHSAVESPNQDKLGEILTLLKQQQTKISQLERHMNDPYEIGESHQFNLIRKAPKSNHSTDEVNSNRKFRDASVQVETNELKEDIKRDSATEIVNDAITEIARERNKMKKGPRVSCRKYLFNTHVRRNLQRQAVKDDAESPTSTRAHPSKPFFSLRLPPLFTLVTLLLLVLGRGISAQNSNQNQFFLCPYPMLGGVPFSPPEAVECPIFNEIDTVGDYRYYNLWFPRNPLQTQITQCQLRTKTKCVDINLLGWKTDKPENYTLRPVSVATCRSMWRTKQWSGSMLIPIGGNEFSTNISMVMPESGCSTVTDAIVQVGTVSVDRTGHMFSTISTMRGCKVEDGYCETQNAVAFWDTAKLQPEKCPYTAYGYLQRGELAGNVIRMSNYPQMFHIANGPLPECIDGKAVLTKEGLVLQQFGNQTLITGLKADYPNYRLNDIQQATCSLHQSFWFFISLVTDLNPTLGIRLATQRKDVQAVWDGDIIRVKSCFLINITDQNIRYDHRLKSTCYLYKPVNIGPTWMFALPSGELVHTSPVVPCPELSQSPDSNSPSGAFSSAMLPHLINSFLLPSTQLDPPISTSYYDPPMGIMNKKSPEDDDDIRKCSKRYSIENGVLLWQSNTKSAKAVIAVPRHMIQEILRANHDHPLSGHLGMEKTYQRIKDRYHWTTLWSDVRSFCRNCIPCARRKRPLKYFHAPMNPTTVDEPWVMVGCDIVGPLPLTENGNKFILVFTDYFTGFTEAFALPDTQASTVANIYINEIVCRYGCVKTLMTDQGPQFMSQLTEEVLKLCNTKHRTSPPYAPWCNGKVERTNGILGDIISQYTDAHDWDRFLKYAVFAYNSSFHACTHQSPHFLLFGRDPVLPADAAFEYRTSVYQEELNTVEDIMKHFTNIYATAREQIQKAQWKQKRNYDKHAEVPEIKIGDLVLVKEPALNNSTGNKFRHQWKNIYRVTEINMPRLTLSRTDRPSLPTRIVHVNNVKLFWGTLKQKPNAQSRSDSPVESEHESEGSVEF